VGKIFTVTSYLLGYDLLHLIQVGSVWRETSIPYHDRVVQSYVVWNFVWGEDPDD
jgi:hypothetical protein